MPAYFIDAATPTAELLPGSGYSFHIPAHVSYTSVGFPPRNCLSR